MEIILASHSPRRRELLAMIASDFVLAPPVEVDESYPSDMPTAEVPVYLSRLKAQAYKPMLNPDSLLLTADTVVINHGHILGKPRDEEQARQMLRELSGHSHSVVTGVTLMSAERTESFAETTLVHFAQLSDEEIRHYVDAYRPMDKAGAYGIQEWIGCIGITGIEGCYYNVMGLPLRALYTRLRAWRDMQDKVRRSVL